MYCGVLLQSMTRELPTSYGARHRAAVGISEITDSITIIVSEETGNISIAENGDLRVYSVSQLRKYLMERYQIDGPFDQDEDEGELRFSKEEAAPLQEKNDYIPTEAVVVKLQGRRNTSRRRRKGSDRS